MAGRNSKRRRDAGKHFGQRRATDEERIEASIEWAKKVGTPPSAETFADMVFLEATLDHVDPYRFAEQHKLDPEQVRARIEALRGGINQWFEGRTGSSSQGAERKQG